MPDLLHWFFVGLEQASLPYCVLRDGDRLGRRAYRGEIDLLVSAAQLPALRRQLASLGFRELPNWGHAPHHFFMARDPQMNDWVKLDVVTELAYGKPVQAWRTSLGANCLRNRRRLGAVLVPAPEDELITLLLHCILDKERIAPARGQRLIALCTQVTDDAYVSRCLSDFGPPGLAWPQLATLIKDENWAALLAERPALLDRLASRDRLGTAYRRLRDRVLRKLNRWAGRLRLHPNAELVGMWRAPLEPRSKN